ncbi:hypothetical protein [Vallitalea okinawensis]|uniref:hypothetical protein n=1 Tax=Vallitalea okinawensis TaxID=2078660 RepID=UPI000CFBAD77|nr:hypothetical protein [Vallitalea okinawensis]
MKNINKIVSLIVMILLPIVISILLSFIGDLIYFNYIAFVIPIYTGLMIIYMQVKTKFKSEFIKIGGLIASAFIQHVYSFWYYLEQQSEFDRWCELNNEPKDLDSIIIFFVAAGFDLLIYILVIAILIALYYELKE